MHMIGNIVKLLKNGRIHHADDEVQAAVVVGDNGEQRRLSLSECGNIKLVMADYGRDLR